MPKTFDAILMCGSCGHGTLHLFHERRPQPRMPGPAPAGPGYVDLIYVCDVCDTARVWGSEPRPPASRRATAREALEEHAIAVHGIWAGDLMIRTRILPYPGKPGTPGTPGTAPRKPVCCLEFFGAKVSPVDQKTGDRDRGQAPRRPVTGR